ncbi:uncharacterized protein sb:cb288 isoform X2 [Trematomus bernacchii]|uniref:uncharacterized protein sb:cb288 isoform X2 n=1 Tax=Trematomus bernacchii TaxID=40690 RepID=UPI00146E01EB|nr:uncharacterized protein sb:cb288 isoform X2 [Trematomus bernacchii]
MKSDRTDSTMWTEVKNRSRTVTSGGNSSMMVDSDLTQQLLQNVQHRNGAIAATVFIAFLLALYAVLWKCMVSPPQRKHSKLRVRVKQRTSV